MADTETNLAITVNGEPFRADASTLAQLIDESGYTGQRVATAVNGNFVPASQRNAHSLTEGDRIEIVAPRQGG